MGLRPLVFLCMLPLQHKISKVMLGEEERDEKESLTVKGPDRSHHRLGLYPICQAQSHGPSSGQA